MSFTCSIIVTTIFAIAFASGVLIYTDIKANEDIDDFENKKDGK